jgi:TatD DNase family protein
MDFASTSCDPSPTLKQGMAMHADPTRLIDSHTHLDFPDFEDDRKLMLQRAKAVGITDIVVAGVTAANWPRLRDVCASARDIPRMHASYGLHPEFMDDHEDTHLDALGDWLQRENAVALGECGLDFHDPAAESERQLHFFRRQLALARELQLPVIIHPRKAVEAVILSLRAAWSLRGVVHSFGGSIEQARQLWDLGFHIGLGGPVTHDGSHRLHRLVKAVPMEQLLLETDAPDQPGAAHRGHRNEPSFLNDVLVTISRLRELPRETVAEATTANARRLFGLP